MRDFYHFLRAWAGAIVHGDPSRKIYVIGVTGTKGKTTTLELLNAILEAAGKKTALLSSLRVKIGGDSTKNTLGNSMPGRGRLQKFLKDAVAAGCRYALIEATSQGAVQSRHRFIAWNAAVWTNLAPEHIESHGSFEKYRAAKLGFLRYAARCGAKIFLNASDPNFGFMHDALAGFRPVAFAAEDEEMSRIMPGITPARAAGDIVPPPFLLSGFNRENIAAAVAVARGIGIGEKPIEDALRHFKGVPGRMEFVQWQPFAAIIDYAHTPDSLELAYRAARQEMRNGEGGRLIAVLGAAGGGRDKWKRPEMGRVAAEYCDKIILTDEDPYDEDPEGIIEEIVSGFPRGVGGEYHMVHAEVVLDRHQAIKRALSLALPGDVVVMTGKGSEDCIHVAKGKKIPWDERTAAEKILAEAKGVVAA